MLIFIDDSGDPGFKFNRGSTNFFVISLIIFDDELEAEKTAVAIKNLKRTLNFPDGMEFKFFRSSNNVRKEFLQTVNYFKFRIRSVVVDKSLIRSEELRGNKNSFYAYTIKTVLKYSHKTIYDAKIKIDGSGDRIFRKSFLSYLKRELNSGNKQIIRNCKMVNSNSNTLIQMADMIAGSIRRSYDASKKDHFLYKSIIAGHIEDEWRFK
ncbi:MAG: DUF3800 domain-containing protein [Candidatus Azambacteria bacterium]|nr:DUF3800 domain-containing protein [Candidatus Azambacteria bacterium]